MKDINEKKQQMKKVVKKGLTLSLCAVLVGGIAAGSYQGVNYLTGWNQPTEVQAAIKREDGLTLTKKESDSGTKNKGSLDVSDIVEEAMPSVVSITTKSVQEVQNYFGMFGYGSYAPEQREVEGAGSGIIVGKNKEELLIATNYHVVENAENVSVSFIDSETCEAKVKGFDEDKDLAIVAVALDDIKNSTLDEISIAAIGSSDDLKVGEQVVAIGNAMGYGQSVTTGIVSAKNRRMNSNSSYNNMDDEDGTNLIQTDAAINPGNSGGALLNMDGEVVGINSAKLASTEIEGVGYAIAISDVSGILERLMNSKTREKIEDGDHGVLEIKGMSVSDEAHQVYGIPRGVLVSEVYEDGAAYNAGITPRCIITEFDGRSISSIEQLVELLTYYEPGEEIEVVVATMAGDGYKEKTVIVKLGESSSLDEREDNDTNNNGFGNNGRDEDNDSDESPDEEDRYNDEEDGEGNFNIFEEWEENQDGWQ